MLGFRFAVEPNYFEEWVDLPLRQQTSSPPNERRLKNLMAKIAYKNGQSFIGCWDVLAWNRESTLFIESKHCRKDAVRDTQLRWLSAGLASGLAPANFMLAEWRFDDE